MNPSRARSRLNAYLEDDLPPRQRARVEAALEASPELRQELAELRGIVDLLRGLPRPEAPPGLAGLVMARVRAGEDEPATLRNYLATQLPEPQASAVRSCDDCRIEFVDYDWGLNDRTTPPDKPRATLYNHPTP